MFDAKTLRFARRKLTPILASEAAECGLACLATVATYYGHNAEISSLRERYPTSVSGMTLRGMMEIASDLGFSCRPLRLELTQLEHLTCPAILHWNFMHFVVLERMERGGQARICDPTRGAYRCSVTELSNLFTGIALELVPVAELTIPSPRPPLRVTQLWSSSKGLWQSSALILGLSIALQLLTFAVPIELQLMVDQAIGNVDENLILVLSITFGALLILQASVNAIRKWLIVILGNIVSFQLIGNLFRHLLRLPADFFEKRHVGDILSRFGSLSAVQEAFLQGLVAAVLDGVMSLFTLAVIFLYSFDLGAIVATTSIINIVINIAFYFPIRTTFERELVARGDEQTYMMESIRGATVLKLLGREVEREGTWRNLYTRVVNTSAQTEVYKIIATALQEAVLGIQLICVLGVGATLVVANDGFTIGMLVAVIAFRQTVGERSASLLGQALKFGLLNLHLHRIADVAAQDKEICASIGQVKVLGKITFDNVSFSYGFTERPILHNVSFTVNPGEFVAITGPSGSGKTTLVKLLLGLAKPSSGRILIDNTEISNMYLGAWRAQVGTVLQNDRLFSGTIASNIAAFDPDFSMERVERAAQLAMVHDDICQLPMRYLSLVGDMGSSLSGGQQQRVLLARALYREPKLIILDEGTANLDSNNENRICDMLASLNVTRLVIAHRLALLERASQILYVDNGKLTLCDRDALVGGRAKGYSVRQSTN